MADASEFDAYATEVKAEVSKAETFKVQADAFNSRIQGFTAELNARKTEKDAEIEIRQRLPLELFKARTEGNATTLTPPSALHAISMTAPGDFSSAVKVTKAPSSHGNLPW